ncbi:ABC-F family ATP-binding cassette domain-containing protein [Salsuginibacillus kocurii]|uniref:ABC-F family ATP-binding cassette domain-containing protein n=1 Tax=Salsuginibacillus kocurii TaxID=427078 RepID=UPI00037E5361|nr:ABC-F type ribosomal protection protein [Salsuginibacillus kocurii]
MIALQIANVTKSFGAETILDQVKLEVKAKERVALVGRNGSGKSTLLKIIGGYLPYDSGEIIMPKESKMGYLAQDTGLESERTIYEEMLGVYEDVIKMEKRIRKLEEKMADPDVFNDPPVYEKVLADYDTLQHTFEQKGGYQYEANIRTILSGLNFGHFSYDTPIPALSGGQKTRLALGKLLLSKPELLILDEPTNHLDIETLSWLENYLNSYEGALLIVSHDRYFLDKIVTKVYEVSRTKIHNFNGNYSYYLEEKARRYEQEMKAFEKQQSEIARLEDFIAKNIVRDSTSKRAQARRKQLEKMDRIDKPDGAEKSAKFSFDIERQSGNEVLNVHDLTFSYDAGAPVIQDIDLQLKRGERAALLGPNGTGKSTILKLLFGVLQPDSGDIRYGSKVSPGYYEQEQTQLNPKKTVLNELWDEHPQTLEKDIRTILGNFLFSGEDVLKSVADLSGGERARVALAKLMMEKPNLLILDEPTNHLDLDSKEVLEAALAEYPGTMLFVSHDRYFLNRIATRILELQPDGSLQEYIGDYDYYLMKKEEEAEREALRAEREAQENARNGGSKGAVASAGTGAGGGADKQAFLEDKEQKREARKRQRNIEKVEANIEQLETETAELQDSLYQPDIMEDYEKAADIQTTIEANQAEIERLMEEWETLQED